jgi:hypothetical protein
MLLLAGLPDGIFSNQKSLCGKINFGGPWIGKVSYTYSMAIWNIFRPLGIFYGHLEYTSASLVYFMAIWYFSRHFDNLVAILVV